MAPSTAATPGAVFLSYAREDTDAARRIAEALRGFGVEVWFDQNELHGGDAWDAKIRRQIKECALFVPLVSQQTEERTEGYFRREWKIAIDRTQDMGSSRAFIVPVVIDGTKETGADVPEEFMRYQWTRLAGGAPTPEFVALVKRLLDAPKKPAASARSAVGASLDDARGRPQGTPLQNKTVPGWAWGAAAAVIVAVGVVVFRQPAPPAAHLGARLPRHRLAQPEEDRRRPRRGRGARGQRAPLGQPCAGHGAAHRRADGRAPLGRELRRRHQRRVRLAGQARAADRRRAQGHADARRALAHRTPPDAGPAGLRVLPAGEAHETAVESVGRARGIRGGDRAL
ncbi:MAG: toll/interleukin-1 receptor domain-containing protein [Opitutae bacterium]|nr:toll/interleukin-1 receptor domain-containing protein [Opitutae bacterium]